MSWRKLLVIAGLLISYLSMLPVQTAAESNTIHKHQISEFTLEPKELPAKVPRFAYDSGRVFEYPDAVRGIYVTGHSAGASRWNTLVDLVDSTELNAMVIDIKDDWGNVTYKLPEDHPNADISRNYIKDPVEMMDTLEEKQIYPIARIVVFKDSVLAEKRPDLSFIDGEKVWKNGREESFVNPFMKEVWDYNIDIAIEAAKLGFQEIQFDYVRFPEGFEKRADDFKYGLGEYADLEEDDVQKRVAAVSDFVAYAKEKLANYGVQVSVDIFGYTATIPEAPGIGQNFTKISENVDVISSMIYPSHWTPYFGIAKPDLEPYKLVREYAKVENEVLGKIENPPVSRPWLQNFTASYLGKGNYKEYTEAEIEAQIKALYDEGIQEYLLWNPSNVYFPDADYTPE